MTAEEEIKKIHQKLSNLETHIINLIMPLQDLHKHFNPSIVHEMRNLCMQPLSIDDRGLKKVLEDFKELMTKFHKGTWSVDPDKVYDCMKNAEKIILSISLRMESLIKDMNEMKREFAKQRVFITVNGSTCNGKELPFTEEQERFLDETIYNIDTTVRLANILHNAKLKTCREILQFGKSNLYEIKNFGKKNMQEIERIFHEKGIEFK